MQSLLSQIVEYLPDMVFVKDARELRFVLLNRRAEELLGYPESELLGKNDYDFFPTEQADFFTQKDREVIAGGVVVDIAAEPIDTTHGPKVLPHEDPPLRHRRTAVSYLLGTSEDITEQNALEVRLAQEPRGATGTQQLCPAHRRTADGVPTDRRPDEQPGGGRRSAEPVRQRALPPAGRLVRRSGVGGGLRRAAGAAGRHQRARGHSGTPRGRVPVDQRIARRGGRPGVPRHLVERAGGPTGARATEHTKVDDYPRLGDALSDLRSQGVRLAIDDAGFATMRHILAIKPDIIKLDIALTPGGSTPTPPGDRSPPPCCRSATRSAPRSRRGQSRAASELDLLLHARPPVRPGLQARPARTPRSPRCPDQGRARPDPDSAVRSSNASGRGGS